MRRPAGAPTRASLYFYLSYARHVPPLETLGEPGDLSGAPPEMDFWVGKLFDDLCATIRTAIRADPRTDVGYWDAAPAAGSNWHSAQTEALSQAEVFVPLYTPRYLINDWPLRERESFRNRLAAAAPGSRPEQHVIPVLWNPFPSTDTFPEIADALRLARDVEFYADTGLHGMCMSNIYATEYWKIVHRLANRIVEVAERFPLGRSAAPTISEVTGPVRHSEAVYVITVLAPTEDQLHEGPVRNYGRSRDQWRPFGAEQQQTIAQYAATVAQWQGLPTRIVVDAVADREVVLGSPGVLLIDPWLLAVRQGEQALRAALTGLPRWATPLVVLDRHDVERSTRAAELLGRVVDMLDDSGIKRYWQVDSVEKFEQLMPSLADKARRQYLRHGPVKAFEDPPITRGRLNDHGSST